MLDRLQFADRANGSAADEAEQVLTLMPRDDHTGYARVHETKNYRAP